MVHESALDMLLLTNCTPYLISSCICGSIWASASPSLSFGSCKTILFHHLRQAHQSFIMGPVRTTCVARYIRQL